MSLYVDIEKQCGDFFLKVKFEVQDEVFAILGASGCGKSMTLKCIAGIEKPDKGVIRLGDKVLFDSEKKINLPARKRKVGYLFQDYALFPNMTVLENIGCATKDKKKAQELVKRFYLEGKEKLYPAQLSGGQKQRVAIARMLAMEPDVILLDEPFSALDNYLKWQLELEIMKVCENFEKSILFVSHDRNEVYRLTNRIAVMEDGMLVDLQKKEELFQNPGSIAATLLTGCKNLSRLEKKEDGRFYAIDWGIYLSKVPEMEEAKYVGFRAHYFEPVAKMEPENVVECEVVRVIEDTFSMIVMFRQKGNQQEGDWSFLRYETSKEAWEQLQGNLQASEHMASRKSGGKLFLKIPQEKLIYLEK